MKLWRSAFFFHLSSFTSLSSASAAFFKAAFVSSTSQPSCLLTFANATTPSHFPRRENRDIIWPFAEFREETDSIVILRQPAALPADSVRNLLGKSAVSEKTLGKDGRGGEI